MNTTDSQLVLTEEFNSILHILKNTKDSIFITGKAGTGKSTLLKYFIENTNKKLVVLAPTGIAALNVGGQTVHSFFKFPPTIINSKKIRTDYLSAELFRNLQMVIIDEVSMVRADLMDGIDSALRKSRGKLDEAFGGVQMVFIGDLFQLSPVLTDADRDIILEKYGGQYFFDAPVFDGFKYHFTELTKIFRQPDEQIDFKTMLNNIRNNNAQSEDLLLLNSRCRYDIKKQKDSVFLTTRRSIARNINKEKLEKLPGSKFMYLGTLIGKYVKLREESEERLEDRLPAPYKLELKENAQIMMLKNDSGRRWVNGTIGKVKCLEEESITVQIDDKEYIVEQEEWNEVEYVLDNTTKEIEETIVAGFSQFPLQLAYAMTIHKSQGKTFDHIVVDVGTGAFTHGQVYVALSRCRTLDGILLNNSINNKDIIVDPRVVEYYKTGEIPKPDQSGINIKNILIKAIRNRNNVKIMYEKFGGEVSERILSNIQIADNFELGIFGQHIVAFCHLNNAEQIFKISRIKQIELVE